MNIFKKSFLTLGSTALVFSGVLLIAVMIFLNFLYNEISTARLGDTAKILMNSIGEDRLTEIFTANALDPSAEIHLPVTADDAYRLTLINKSGDVIWDSQIARALVNHIDRDEVLSALEGREASARRNSISTGMPRLYYALPVFDNYGNSFGVFRLSFALPGFWAAISPASLPFFVFMCLMVLVIFCVILVYSQSLSMSLGRLVNIVKTGTKNLSGNEAAQPIALEFRSLERSLRAVTLELNTRFENARSEGSRLEAILNGMSEAVFAMDMELKLHLVNPAARSLFNLGGGNIENMTLLEATRSTELIEIAKKAISSSIPLEIELTFHTGPEKHFLIFASPLARAAAGGKTNEGVVLVLQEITRLVKLERIRKDFVANVSHELRTPIQLIKGFSENLLDAVSSQDSQQQEVSVVPNEDVNQKQLIKSIKIIHKNACTMEYLTNDLLSLASLETGENKTYEMKEEEIASLIDEAAASLDQQAKLKQIELIVESPKGLKANVCSSLIVQALVNMIDNSIKYSPAESKIWINAYLENEAVVFEVRDKGIGIRAEHLERIFERFYRVDRARSKEAGGTGLGLSIVRHIALVHNGRAEVESRAGEGSIFRIRIPR